MNEILFLVLFVSFVLIVLFLDLGIFDKHSHKISFKESLIWTGIWIFLALAFFVFLLLKGEFIHGIDTPEKLKSIVAKHDHSINVEVLNFSEALNLYRSTLAIEYLTGYLIEYTLSIDNIFVIFMIFVSFNINEIHYKRILFWGILGAVVFRFVFIFFTSALIQKFSWIFYVFGAILLYSGVKMIINRNKEEKIDTHNHPIIKFVSKFFRLVSKYEGERFFVRINGKIFITPLFLVLLIVEFSDIIFAIDSVPAIYSVTKDPYIVFFSNVFAILGLRSLFFLIVNIINYFRFLKLGISFLLIFIGFKLIFHSWLKEIGFSTTYSLYLVLFVLFGSILLSIILPPSKSK
jgi:tellurite resistance protein TerC